MVSHEPDDSARVTYRGSRCLLADMVVPKLIDSQIAKFTIESLRAIRTRSFDPHATLHTLSATRGAGVVAIDIGGDKLIATSYNVRQGTLIQEGKPLVKEGTAGAGYIDVLEKVSALARTRLLPIGVSYAGPIQGSKVLAGVNIPVFMRDFQLRYNGDFANLHSQMTLVNDAEAGVMAASLEAVRRYPAARHVIYVINGSGIGGAVLKDGAIYATEAGHIPAEGDLNSFGQQRPCGLLGATYVCLERVGASKAGIEDIWFQQREEKLTGKEIAAAYLAGDELALRLYESSALVTAHIVKGMAKALGLLREWDDTIVVGHGGTFHVPGYGDRVRSILEKDLSSETRMLFTNDFSSNTCLDGAAIAGMP